MARERFFDSREDLAHAVNRILPPAFIMTANDIGKIERGVVSYPRAARRRALRIVLHASHDSELGLINPRGSGSPAAGDPGEDTSPSGIPTRRPNTAESSSRWTVDGPPSRISYGEERDVYSGNPDAGVTVDVVDGDRRQRVTLSRRMFLQITEAGLASTLIGATSGPAPRTVDPAIVDHFARLRSLLVDTDNRLGGFTVLPTAIQQERAIAQFRRATSGQLRQELLKTQARWAEFVGWLNDDLGDTASGSWWIAQAMDMAHEAEDTELIAFLFARRAQRETDGPDRDRVLGLAMASHRVGGPPLVAAFGAVQQAHGHAINGDETAFRTATELARQLSGTGPPADTALGSFCTSPYLSAQEGDGWLRLGKPRTAADCYARALNEWPRSYQRERGLCLSRTAKAHLSAGHPEQAADTAIKALQMADLTQSMRIRHDLDTLAATIGRYGHQPAVKALLTALAASSPT